jgi:hypothetical protein
VARDPYVLPVPALVTHRLVLALTGYSPWERLFPGDFPISVPRAAPTLAVLAMSCPGLTSIRRVATGWQLSRALLRRIRVTASRIRLPPHRDQATPTATHRHARVALCRGRDLPTLFPSSGAVMATKMVLPGRQRWDFEPGQTVVLLRRRSRPMCLHLGNLATCACHSPREWYCTGSPEGRMAIRTPVPLFTICDAS